MGWMDDLVRIEALVCEVGITSTSTRYTLHVWTWYYLLLTQVLVSRNTEGHQRQAENPSRTKTWRKMGGDSVGIADLASSLNVCTKPLVLLGSRSSKKKGRRLDTSVTPKPPRYWPKKVSGRIAVLTGRNKAPRPPGTAYLPR